MAANDAIPIPAFRKALKRYRRRPNEPDHVDDLDDSLVIDFLVDDDRIAEIVPGAQVSVPATGVYGGPLFGLKAYPGFLFLPSALSEELLTALALAAVSQYCEKPHATNIDAVLPKPSEIVTEVGVTMWALWKQGHGFVTERTSVDASETSNSCGKTAQSHAHYYRSFRKLSWATCGYHYDWTARAYPRTAQSPVPLPLAKLARIFADTALQIEDREDSTSQVTKHTAPSLADRNKFEATACIVNYYDNKAVMGCHRDDSEEAVTKPVISFSMGRPALFLLGGANAEDEPVIPIVVRPGDVMILGGASRLNYHAVARLLPQELPETKAWRKNNNTLRYQLGIDSVFEDGSAPIARTGDLEALSAFLSQHRININIRQVYDDHFSAKNDRDESTIHGN